MMRNLAYVLSLLILALATPFLVKAEPYASVIVENKIKDPYILAHLRGITVPTKAEVPVPRYGGALISQVSNIIGSAEGMYQENIIMNLATTDSPEQVIGFYKAQFPAWKFEALKSYTLFLKEGDQKFWGGGQTLLKAPRIEIHDLADLENVSDPAKIKLKKELPELKTLIKIFYEKSISKQNSMDLDTLFTNCLEKKTNSLKKSLNKTKIDSAAEKFFKNSATAHCQKIRKSCEKDQSVVNCQKAMIEYK